MIKLVIAGSRSVRPTPEMIDQAVREIAVMLGHVVEVDDEVRQGWVGEVICGEAEGGDAAGAVWAHLRAIPIWHEPITNGDVERWGKYVAPKMRNRRMSERADAAICYWDGTSNGTTDFVTRMVLRRKPVLVVPMKPEPGARRHPGPRAAKPCCPRFAHGDGTHDLACKVGGRPR